MRDMSRAASSLLLELFFFRLSPRLSVRFVQLLGEASALALLALLFPFVLRLSQGGMIALFLVAATLLKRVQFLIDEHRDNIWEKGLSNRQSHWIFASSTTALFLGTFGSVFLFFFVVKSTHSASVVERFFDFVYQTSSIQPHVPLYERIHSLVSLLINNFMVLLTTLLLTLLYRTLGLALILTWNAFVWSVTMAALFHYNLLKTTMNKARFVVQSFVAVSPHLIIETVAYILVAMGALFLSKALTLYPMSDDRFQRSAWASFQLLLTASILLLVGALLEINLPRILLPR